MKTLVGMTSLCVALLVSAPAAASSITFDFAVSFSNANVPGGTAPWIKAVFDDTTAGAGYDVRLTLTTPGLVGSEFISSVFFNFDPLLDPSDVDGVLVSDTSGAYVGASTGLNAFQADGDGLYDFMLNFSSDPPRLTGGQTVVFDLNLDGGTLTAANFNFLAAPGGGEGPFYAAAHLQGIGTNGALSTWIADGTPGTGDCPGCTPTPLLVQSPEPGSMILLGSGLVAVAFRRYRARKARKGLKQDKA